MLMRCKRKQATKGDRQKASKETFTQLVAEIAMEVKCSSRETEGENNERNDNARVTNGLLIIQHLAMVLPCPHANYLHVVDKIT